jgi:endonuclease YncB( thermonuclease family)
MFFRRKKSDGFDWHTYVRTTIKLRRDQRRAKIEEIGRVAAHQAKAAGDAAVQGVAQAASSGWRASAAAWRNTIAQPSISLPITLCGAVAVASGGHRWATIGADRDALVPLLLGGVLLAAVAPLAIGRLMRGTVSMPSLSGLKGVVLPQALLPAAAVGGVVLVLGWFAWGQAMPGLSGPGPTAKSSGAASTLEGRATVISGEMIRLQGRLLHLSGIEAPDRQQTCTRATKQPWKCGEAALQALERLARSKSFRCVTQGGPDALGRIEANCTVDGRDVAGELVKDGHVFSAATYFGGYTALEQAARKSGAGVWSGEAERPADFRSKLWDAAKATAPGGCPIKGTTSSSRKTYLMPWAGEYARANVRPERGEKWFCTEADAQAAGFKAPTGTAPK